MYPSIENHFRASMLFALLLALPGAAYSQKASDVNVVNTPAVRLADRPEKQPFTDTLVSVSKPSFRVPTGKRLVIEYVSGSGFISTGQKFFFTGLQYFVLLNGGIQGDVLAALTPTLMATRNTGTSVFDLYSISQATRFYVEPGGLVTLHQENPAVPAGWVLTISGYLVDLP